MKPPRLRGVKLERGRLVAGGIGVVVGVASTFDVDVYRDWSLGRRCEERMRHVEIFLKDEAAPEAVDALERELAENPDVESVDYVSREDAYEEFKKLYEDEPHLYETIDADDLPAFFRLVASDEEAVAELFELEDPAIDEIRRDEGDPDLAASCAIRNFRELRDHPGARPLTARPSTLAPSWLETNSPGSIRSTSTASASSSAAT